jgi:hypothetical protein
MYPITAQAFNGINTQATEYVLQFNTPASKQVSQTSSTDIRIYSLGQSKIGCTDTPGTLPGVTLLADMATKGNKGGCPDINGISTQCNCLDHVTAISDAP